MRKCSMWIFSGSCLLVYLFNPVIAQTIKPDTISPIFDFNDDVINVRASDFNNTNFLRILNGVILSDDYKVSGSIYSYEFIKESNEIKKLGIETTKPIVLINIKEYEIEYEIDSILYSRPDFITTFKYPTSIQLPIAINGELVYFEEREKILDELTLDKIRDIGYLNKEVAMQKFNNKTPFGVIGLMLK